MTCAIWFILGWLSAAALIAPFLAKHLFPDDGSL